MPDPTLVNVPREAFERMATAPLELARLEAAEFLRRGDTAGANAKITEGVAQSAAIRAQAAAQQQAQQQPAPAQQPAAQPPPQALPAPRNASEYMIQRYKEHQASLVRAEDPRLDMRQSYGLTPLRK
jgi:hypothetical protein